MRNNKVGVRDLEKVGHNEGAGFAITPVAEMQREGFELSDDAAAPGLDLSASSGGGFVPAGIGFSFSLGAALAVASTRESRSVSGSSTLTSSLSDSSRRNATAASPQELPGAKSFGLAGLDLGAHAPLEGFIPKGIFAARRVSTQSLLASTDVGVSAVCSLRS